MQRIVLRVEDLRERDRLLSLDLRPEDLDLGEVLGARPKGNIRGKVLARRVGKKITVDTELDFVLLLTCSRCLAEFPRDFHETLSVVFLKGEPALPQERRLGPEDFETLFFTGDEIDIAPLIREMVVLAVPQKPLCKPDCRGLCPVCGADLNREACDHSRQETEPAPDPRWAKLLELKKEE